MNFMKQKNIKPKTKKQIAKEVKTKQFSKQASIVTGFVVAIVACVLLLWWHDYNAQNNIEQIDLGGGWRVEDMFRQEEHNNEPPLPPILENPNSTQSFAQKILICF